MHKQELKLKLYPWELTAHFEVFLSNKSYISFHDGKKILDKRLLSSFEVKLINKILDSIKISAISKIGFDSLDIRTDPDIQSKLIIKYEWGNLSIVWSNSVEDKKPFSTISTLQNLLFELLPLDDLSFDFPIYQ